MNDFLRDSIDFEAWIESAWAYAAPRLPNSLALIGVGLFLWLIAHWFLYRIATRLAAKTENRFDDALVAVIRACVLISIGFWVLWRLSAVWLPPGATKAVVGAWIVVLAIPLARFATTVLATVTSHAIPASSAFDRTAMPWIKRLVMIVIVGTAVMISFDQLGISVAPLLAGAGVAGLAISLAAKDTLSNLIAGILLVIDRPFVVGDRIELWRSPANSASWGDVVEIGLRATKIRNTDNVIIVIPNDEIMRRDIINYTATGQSIRLRIAIPIAYDADTKLAKKLVIDVASATAGVSPEPPPVCIIHSFGESSIDLQLRIWLEDARQRRAIADHITDRVKEVFDDNGVKIPFPARDVFIHQLPAADPDNDASSQAKPSSTAR